MTTPVERLQSLVGEAANKPRVTDEVFRKALEKINKENQEKAQEQAEGLIRQAVEIRDSMSKARSEFNKQEQKFNKQLGLLLNQIEAQLKGKEPPKEDEEKEDE
jgi:hypothetical protein